jgi:hypothetical protein
MPRRVIGGATVDRVLVSLLIVAPKRALFEIGRAELPPFPWIVKRAWRRLSCSSFEIWSMNFTIVMSLLVSILSKLLI